MSLRWSHPDHNTVQGYNTCIPFLSTQHSMVVRSVRVLAKCKCWNFNTVFIGSKYWSRHASHSHDCQVYRHSLLASQDWFTASSTSWRVAFSVDRHSCLIGPKYPSTGQQVWPTSMKDISMASLRPVIQRHVI